MVSNLRKTAIDLANKPYSMIVFLDEATDGTFGFVAINPELEGCMAQGDTFNEAVDNLNGARIDYLESMLEDNMPIPEPELLSESILFRMSELLSYDDFNLEAIPYNEPEPPKNLNATAKMVKVIQSSATMPL